jgi:glycosyltransferase involved in cell wall biosynthesis
MKIGIAIPCFIKHIDKLYNLFESINQQTRLPDQVVVSCSSSKPDDLSKIYENISHYKFPFIIVAAEERKNAAQNRNKAASYLNTDVITFFDADDIMHPQRIQAIEYAFYLSVDVLLHSFFEGNECDQEFPKITNFNPMLNVLSIARSGCITFNYRNYRIHHGQVTVTKAVFDKVKFPEDESYETREDCVFCVEVFRIPNIQSGYFEYPLSKYYESRTCHSEKR